MFKPLGDIKEWTIWLIILFSIFGVISILYWLYKVILWSINHIHIN